MFSIPLFRSDNTEPLEVADAYEVSNEKPINKVYEASKNKAKALYERAGGAQGVITSVDQLIKAKDSGVKGVDLLERGLGMFGTSSAGLLRTVGGDMIDKAGAYVDLDPALTRKIKTTADGLYTTVKAGRGKDLDQYGNLVSLMGDLSGNPELAEQINIGYESAVWAVAFTEANEYGAYDYYRKIKATSVDPAVYRQAVIYSLPSVATSGSLEALTAVLESITPDEIMAHVPNFIATFLGQFALPEPLPEDLEAYSEELVSCLDSLNPQWYTYSAGGTYPVYDLTCLVQASPDARQVLSSHPILGPLSQVAPHYPEQSVADVIRSQFPKMVLNLK